VPQNREETLVTYVTAVTLARIYCVFGTMGVSWLGFVTLFVTHNSLIFRIVKRW